MINVRAKNFLRSRFTFSIISLFQINVVEHRHEDDSTFKLFWIYLLNVQIFLDFSEDVDRRESLENVPLELNWFSIDSN